ncbi:protein KASH5 isoform X7 [Catharus ustulatus]|uniref:protein KASH5 isoform X7 n=1 Tax=Catharus ustulatus TaxID=91951 RepID=UPI00140BA1BB|nr:protein KASH5 isoform X7 [Catharus ustulatus]
MAAEGPCAPGAVIPLPAPDESGCSDEFALDCTFAACDPEQTGMVQPQRVVEYVAAMTGHSGHDGRLRALRRALDPAAAGTALDWARFRTAMGAWIAACRQDGAEEQDTATGDTGPVLAEDDGHASPAASQLPGDNTDATSPAEAAGLRSRARQLAAQNTKLQRDAEQAEELNTRLAEEIAQLQAQLRSSRQALEQARVAIEELDDMKAMVKGLEEENTELRRQARHAEKEQHSLCSRAEGLQEENQRLLAEGQGLREQIQAQAARMASLEVSTWPRRAVLGLCHTVTRCPCPHPSAQAQLCRGTALLSARDTALAQAGQRAQELTAALEEYERMVQVWHVRPLCEPRQRPQSPWATAQPHPLCGGQGQGVTTPFSLQELRLETTRLRQQLGRLRDAWAMYGRDTCVGHVLRALWHPQLSILTLLSLPQAPVVPAQPAGHPGHGGGRPGKAGVRGDPAGCPQPLTPRFCPGHGGQGGGGRGRRG